MSDNEPQAPELDEEALEVQRGEDPPEVVGRTPGRPADPDPDPGYVPDPDRGHEWQRLSGEIAKEYRPRREDVYPYLLIRAAAGGDRGQRPIWPPTVCWESPDLLLIDASYTGPFDPGRLVVSPIAGRSYRVFVRVWNLGLLPAVGVHVRVWAVAAGFFGAGNADDPYYRTHEVGGAWIDQLTDRRQPGCTVVQELDQVWATDPAETGHHCLIASVSCPADRFAGPLLVNEFRHVGQRNLTILEPADTATELLGLLGSLVPRGLTLEVTHGGPAALPLLQALSGGRLPVGNGEERIPIVVPALKDIGGGVDIGTSVHLLTAFEENGRTVVASSARLEKLVLRSRFGERVGRVRQASGTHPFAESGGTRRLLDKLGPDRWEQVGIVTDQSLAAALVEGLGRLFDTRELSSGEFARSFGGPEGAQHLLRLTVTDQKGALVGGYSIIVRG